MPFLRVDSKRRLSAFLYTFLPSLKMSMWKVQYKLLFHFGQIVRPCLVAPLVYGARIWRGSKESKENISPDFPPFASQIHHSFISHTETTVPGGCLANAEAGWLTLHNCKSHMLKQQVVFCVALRNQT